MIEKQKQFEKVISVRFDNYQSSVDYLLNDLSFYKKLNDCKKVIIKPNLLEAEPHPCTTDVECVRAIINYIKAVKNNLEIIVIEGSGGCPTEMAFKTLGYNMLEKIDGVRLLDVDKAELVRLKNKDALAYKEIYLPEEIFGGLFISVPVLKDHMLTVVTLGMKNLIGLLPEKHYGGYWSYKRSDVHRVGINNAIVDLNTYVKVDLTITDGRIGQQGSHLPGGRRCNPAKNMLLGSYDIFESDRKAAEILGHDPDCVKHLQLYSEHIKHKK